LLFHCSVERVERSRATGFIPLSRVRAARGFSLLLTPGVQAAPQPLSAVEATDYIEKNARGTAKGWRWDQSWTGVYSIVINEKRVEDWWDEQAVERLFPNGPARRDICKAGAKKPWWRFWERQ
jgi:hypothetical protein